jgi:uncharacterized protein YecE (DUF72 family)
VSGATVSGDDEPTPAPRGTLRVGTSGFSYPGWAPLFYPSGLRPEGLLTAYAERLSACELNTTFYRQPAPSAVAGWLARTPTSFRFVVKAQRSGTVRALLGDDQAESVGWLTRPLAGFGQRLGSVLYRVPADIVRSAERHDHLARLLDLWPSEYPLTLEFQDASWHVDETFALIRDRGAVLCATDLDDLSEPPIVRLTGPFLYLRLRRTTYDDAEIEAWAGRIAPFLDAGIDAYAFFRHDESGISPNRAIALAGRLAVRSGA